MNFHLKHISWFWLLFLLHSGSQAEQRPLPADLTNEILAGILIDGFKPHEALPLGPPKSYDWAHGPRRGRWNSPPAGFLAGTGWGQIFYIDSYKMARASTMFVRRFQTFICSKGPHGQQWSSTQQGALEGRQFHPDFEGNLNKPAMTFNQTAEEAEISFEPGQAFHFWPRSGRFDLSNRDLCGWLVVLQAKQRSENAGELLIGLGADYWATRTAPWDNYKTNKDVGIGRMRLGRENWKWVGLTTANVESLNLLQENGYVVDPKEVSLGNKTSNEQIIKHQ